MTQVLVNNPSPTLVSVRPGSKHVSGLALLRGIAALSVALYHYTGAVLPKLHVDVVQTMFSRGFLGVDVFFVISGFVIPYSLLGKGYTPRRFFAYIFKRIVRINPPAYIAMVLVLAQWYLIDHYIAHQIKYTAGLSARQISHNLLFTIPFTDYKWVVGIFWTLAIEFQFYIFIGLAFNYLFEKENVYIFVVVFLLISLVQYLPFRSTENFFHSSTLFALGGLTLFKNKGRIGTPVYWGLLLFFGMICWWQLEIYTAVVGVATALAIEYVSLENTVTRFMGKISYSFYLVHALVGNTCEFVLVKLFSIEPVFNRVLLQVTCLAIAIGTAYVFYLLIERPFMRAASRLKT